MSSLDIKTFLATIHPFDVLSKTALERLSDKVDVVYHKDNAVLVSAGDACEFFYIVAKGVVKEEGESDYYYGVRDFFDFESLLGGSYKSSFKTEEESLLYVIAKEDFLFVVHSDIKLENYFFLSAAKKLEQKYKGVDSYLVQRISDITYETPIFIHHTSTIHEAVTLMSSHNKTFTLVEFENKEFGIVTDSDLRKKVLLKKLDIDSRVGDIATRNIKTIEHNDFLFNALLLMTKHNIKRIALTNDGAICGVLQDIDILGALSTHTQFVARKIEFAKSKEELRGYIAEIDASVKNLLEEGVKVKHIVKLVSELNSKVFQKVFEWSFDDRLRQKSALVIFGSEGRGEQILRTDQDNGVIFDDDVEVLDIKAATTAFNDTLIFLGYPPCDGGVMAKEPMWGKSLKEYKKDIYDLILTPNEQSFLRLPILMDTKFIAGKEELCGEILEYLNKKLSENRQLIARMAGGSLAFETPLGMLGGFVLDKKEHSGELDIKKGGIFPIVNSLRALAFEKGIAVTNSFERIKELNNTGLIDRAFAEELMEAYNFLLEIRLKERLYKIKAGHTPDNYISPDRLTKLERDLLKDVLKIVDKLKKFVFAHFKLGYLS